MFARGHTRVQVEVSNDVRVGEELRIDRAPRPIHQRSRLHCTPVDAPQVDVGLPPTTKADVQTRSDGGEVSELLVRVQGRHFEINRLLANDEAVRYSYDVDTVLHLVLQRTIVRLGENVAIRQLGEDRRGAAVGHVIRRHQLGRVWHRSPRLCELDWSRRHLHVGPVLVGGIDKDHRKLVLPGQVGSHAPSEKVCEQCHQARRVNVVLEAIEDSREFHLELEAGPAAVDVHGVQVVPLRYDAVGRVSAPDALLLERHHRVEDVAPGVVRTLGGHRVLVVLHENAPIVRRPSAYWVQVCLALVGAHSSSIFRFIEIADVLFQGTATTSLLRIVVDSDNELIRRDVFVDLLGLALLDAVVGVAVDAHQSRRRDGHRMPEAADVLEARQANRGVHCRIVSGL
mmetsp:Transcript_401/g.1769  ORF Transcript_401/g.1769 Transcript_401/m.1769 type:complete len:399 (+) Transcript_401:7421-8617(+)